MIVHGVPLSPFVRKTLFVLHELGLDFEQKMVLPQGEAPDFRAVSPLGRIPGFEDGDFTLSDSSAICHYLALRHDSDLMGRAEPQRFAQIVWYDKYADEDVAPTLLSLLFECIVKPMRFQQVPDEARVATLLEDTLPPILDFLEAQLATGAGEWFVGDVFSYADLALAGHLSSLSLLDRPLDATRWPLLAAWLERVSARSSVAHVLAAARRLVEDA